MLEDIVLGTFPKSSGAYLFKTNDEVIYVGSSKNIYHRMTTHRSCIRQGGNHSGTSKQDLYQYLQANPFTVELYLTDNYRQLEQELIEQHNPKYNSNRANTGVAWNGNRAEYEKEYNEKYQYQKQYQSKYINQLCLYEGQIITLHALYQRFWSQGITKPTAEAKKYLIRSSNND